MIKISTRVVSVENRDNFIKFLKGEYFPCDVREEDDEIIIDINITVSDAFEKGINYGKMVVKDDTLETLEMCLDILVTGKYPASANDESFKKLQSTINNLKNI